MLYFEDFKTLLYNFGNEVDPVVFQDISKYADVVDQINNKLGKSIIIYGAQGIQKEPVRFNAAGGNWQMKSYYRSPAYTTRWDELLKVS